VVKRVRMRVDGRMVGYSERDEQQDGEIGLVMADCLWDLWMGQVTLSE